MSMYEVFGDARSARKEYANEFTDPIRLAVDIRQNMGDLGRTIAAKALFVINEKQAATAHERIKPGDLGLRYFYVPDKYYVTRNGQLFVSEERLVWHQVPLSVVRGSYGSAVMPEIGLSDLDLDTEEKSVVQEIGVNPDEAEAFIGAMERAIEHTNAGEMLNDLTPRSIVPTRLEAIYEEIIDREARFAPFYQNPAV